MRQHLGWEEGSDRHALQQDLRQNQSLNLFSPESKQMRQGVGNIELCEFQGIHDRFLRDHECRIRMIENHRVEDLCGRWDALSDEDHTHHLTAEEYLHYNSKEWLHLNEQCSNTMPLRHRSDFKQALSTLQRLQQEAGEEPNLPTYFDKHKQWEARIHGGIGKVHGRLLLISKVKKEMH